MILDAHTHLFPPEVRERREAFFDGEDDFCLLYRDPRSRLVGAAELVAYLDDEGIDAACSFAFPWRSAQTTRVCNDYCLAAAREFPGRILPLACVNPLAGVGALREAERCLAAGARGLGEIATYADGLGPEVRSALAPLADLCREAGVPLLLHTNEPVGHAYPGKSPMEHSQLYALVAAHPDTRWLLAHWGGGLFAYYLLKKEADDVLRNCWFDTAAGPFLYKPDVYRRFLDIAGPNRLVFGSDYPLLGLSRYRRDADAAGLSPQESRGLFGENARQLFGIDRGDDALAAGPPEKEGMR